MKQNPSEIWTGAEVACVMMCGGGSTRFASRDQHKSMATAGDAPLLHHVVSYWRKYTENFVFVVKHGKEEVVDYARRVLNRPRFVEPEALRGIADGLRYAEPLVGERFIVVLGDCFSRGHFLFPESTEAGVGVLRNAPAEQIQRNYAVYVTGDLIVRVQEKPKVVDTDLCGLGFYFLNRRIFDAIRETPPSALRNEVELTDALQTMINSGVRLRPVVLDGDYVNVTYQSDMEVVRRLLDQG